MIRHPASSKGWSNKLFNDILRYYEANFELLLLRYFFMWDFCPSYSLRFFQLWSKRLLSLWLVTLGLKNSKFNSHDTQRQRTYIIRSSLDIFFHFRNNLLPLCSPDRPLLSTSNVKARCQEELLIAQQFWGQGEKPKITFATFVSPNCLFHLMKYKSFGVTCSSAPCESLFIVYQSNFFIGPESDHWLCLSLTDWLTDWLTAA